MKRKTKKPLREGELRTEVSAMELRIKTPKGREVWATLMTQGPNWVPHLYWLQGENQVRSALMYGRTLDEATEIVIKTVTMFDAVNKWDRPVTNDAF